MIGRNRTMKYAIKSTVACIIVVSLGCFAANADEYAAVYNPQTGYSEIWRYNLPRNETITTMTTELFGIRFHPSPNEKKLMYLEKTHLADVNLRPYFASGRWSPYPYNPEDIVLVLHICDQHGNDLQTIPIERKYSYSYNAGRWLGDKMVILFLSAHNSGPYTLCVYLTNSMKLIVPIESSKAISPDGEHLVINWDRRILYDGVQVLPFYDPDPFFLSDPPDSPKYGGLKIWKEDRRKALETENFPDVSWFHTIREGKLAWIEGGKKFALVDNRPAALLFHEKKEEFTQEILVRSRAPELVIVDVEKISTGDINQYAQRFHLQIDYIRLGKVASSGSWPFPTYDEKENVIKVQAYYMGPTGALPLQTIATIPVP